MTAVAANIREIASFWPVFTNLVARDLKVKYQTKSLGFLWSLIYPATMLGIWYVIFSKITRIPIPDYWAYLIAGILPFQFIQQGISDGAGSIRRNSGIIRKVYVPMEVLVAAGVTMKMIEFIMQMTVALALLFALHHTNIVPIGPDQVPTEVGASVLKSIVVLPGAMLLLFVFVLGVSMPLAAYTIIYRDLEHMIGLLMTALFYLTPIFWSLVLLPDYWWKALFVLNPAVALV
ncbi:MAG: ABC transporter permease, partial [Chthoniobacterales bacterium]|nr:ABC transporter permease [Chthoniobacterales bacterium]